MATLDDILGRLFEYLAATAPDGIVMDEDIDLVGTLGLDSITVINMVLELEDEYDVSVPLNTLADVRTAGELARLVHRLCEKG
jgi:acyl carrier protein